MLTESAFIKTINSGKRKKESKKQHVTQLNTVACLIAQQHDTVCTESNMG
jgi:hypothetical protein